MAFTGGLEKMRVKAFADSGFHQEVGSFQVWINPAEYRHVHHVCYNDRQAQGSPGGSPDFNRITSDQVSLQLVFDGTGVVPGPTPGVPAFAADGVAKQVDAFRALVFDYDGKIHSPRFLQLVWGTLLFRCRLLELSVAYTLFKPDGTPLRARADAAFVGYTDEVELARMARKSSPDLTHVRTVREGDTLPLLCWEVYGSSAWYPRVARANGLAGFRELPAGTRLVFPPLRDGRA
jgi:phage tail protein X